MKKALKFSHHYWNFKYQLPFGYFLLHRLITVSVNPAFRSIRQRIYDKNYQWHVDGTCFWPSIANLLPTLDAWTHIFMRRFLHSSSTQMKSLNCSVPGSWTSRRILISSIPLYLPISQLKDTLSLFFSVPILVTSSLPNIHPFKILYQPMVIM